MMTIKRLLIICFTFGLAFTVKAQIPNGDFESWSGNDPVSWVTTNGLMFFSNPQSVFNSTKPHGGSGACEMRAVHITGKPPGVPVPDYVGSIFIGKQIGFNSIRGFAYTSRPAQLEFWDSYTGTNGDTANALVVLTKWNASNGKPDTIAVGFYSRSMFDTAYKKESITLNYLSTQDPDTAILMFSSVSITSTQAGAVYTIDDLMFTGGNVGLNEWSMKPQINCYPNPASDILYVNIPNTLGDGQLLIIDMQGRICKEVMLNKQKDFEVDVRGIKPGLYLVQLISEGQLVSTKISIGE